MDTALKKDIYEEMELIWSGVGGREASEEYVVPDSMPDIGAVVDAEGILTVRGKETEAGYVQLSATIAVSVLYQPEDGGAARSLEFSLPAEVRLDAPGVDAECRTVARLRLRGVDARVINSRKLAIRADIEAAVQCYRKRSLAVASAAERDEGMHLLTRTAEALMISDLREKVFVVTDEYPLPAGCGAAGAIVSRRADAVVEDVKYVSGKMVFRGRVRAELMFSSSEDGRLYVGKYETEFSQIMEVEAGDEALGTVTLFFTGAYFDLPESDREAGRVDAELHLAAQCVCREKRNVAYIADAYSNRTELVPSLREEKIVPEVRAVTLRHAVTGRSEGLAGDGEIVCARASVGSVSLEDGVITAPVSVRLVCRRSDGSCAADRCRLTAEFPAAELPEDASLRDMTAAVTDVFCTAAGGGVEVRVSLRLDALAVSEQSLTFVDALEEDAEAWSARARTPSATILRVPAGTDLWTLARRYHSTTDAIAAANGDRRDGLLLIPKAT